MMAISMQAQQLREGHFFKSFDDVQPTAQDAPTLFSKWFRLPEDTEWREISRQTDNIGMERIEYRQYVGGIEVEYSQVLLHVRDGRVLSANGTVMEQQRTPARLQRHSMMHRSGTPTDLLGRQLLLIDTDDGYRYATMCISADGRYKVYHDMETGEELKRVPLIHSIDPPVGTPATITGRSVYSGDVPLDVTEAAYGLYYLYDQQRNIHTVVGGYLPTFDYLFYKGKAFDYFPRYELTEEDVKKNNSEKIIAWLRQIYADQAANNLPGYEKYIKDFMGYEANMGDLWTDYRLKSMTLSYDTLKLDPDSYLSFTFYYSQGTMESTSYGKLWSDTTALLNTTIDFPKRNKTVIIPTEGATLVVSVVKEDKGETTQNTIKTETVLEVIPFTLSPDATVFEVLGQKVRMRLDYEPNASTPLADIHWGMGRTVDFYKEKFNRDSYDNQHAPIYNLVYIDDTNQGIVSCPQNNAMAVAYCKPYPMIYGMGGSNMNPVVELTVMAHEFTHIITDQNAKLEYKSESGALNESFSDIMGISVKKWNDPNYKLWLIGGDGLMLDYTNVRDMKNPRNSMDGKNDFRRCPGYYHGYDWKDTSNPSRENDNGGVHINSGVQNRWYTLLCDGDTGDNSNFVEGGTSYTMTGIGMEKALQIAYRTLMQYATSQSQYADIRLSHIQAAKDLYGDNSPEVEAVIKAWDIVGVTEGTSAGIVEVKANSPLSALNSQLSDWYTLDGTRLSGQPTAHSAKGRLFPQGLKKGIYIHQGKKVVIK